MSLNQLSVVHEVATKFWELDDIENYDVINRINIKIFSESRIIGVLPSWKDYPSAFFKIFVNKQNYENEKSGNNYANSFLPIDGIYVPKILYDFPENFALIFEFISMKKALPELKRIFKKKAHINWKNLGAWLRAFHDSKNVEFSNPEFLNNLIKKVEKQVASLNQLFNKKILDYFELLFLLSESFIAKSEIDWVLNHGDFNIDSLGIANQSVCVYDFERLTTSPRSYEVINFLAGLQSSIYFIFRKKHYSYFANEFLKGYGFPLENHPLNDLFYLSTYLDLIIHYNKRKNHTLSIGKANLFSFYEREIVNFLTKKMLEPNRTYF